MEDDLTARQQYFDNCKAGITIAGLRTAVSSLKETMTHDAIRSLLEAALHNDEAYFQLMAQAAA